MKRTWLGLILFLAAALLFAQKKESLAVFAFTGGSASDGEAIASSLTRQTVLRDAFNRTTLITRSTIASMNFEQRFQRDSGLTDADTIFELGKALNASHVIAGYITRLGDQNLILVSIMDVESLQQIAGDYRTYSNIEEVSALIPEIAQKLAAAVPRNTSNFPGLSVPPFNIASGVNRNDAMVLAQILSCELANGSKYAVLPRTDSVEAVLAEQRRQRDGTTDQERVRRLGEGRNAQYVLSGSVQRLGTMNMFTADILNIVDGSFTDGYEEQYTDFSQGFELIPILAMQVTGTPDFEMNGTVLVKYLGNAANVIIPTGVSAIGNRAFYDCKSLTSVSIPNSVTSINESAFHGCTGLTSVIIPASVRSIGRDAFFYCTNLRNITVNAINPSYASEDGILYTKTKLTLVRAPSGIGGNVTIPAGVRYIDRNAFSYCRSLTGITIPTSVTNIGEQAFWQCTRLSSITIPSGVTSIGRNAFSNWTSSQTINVRGKANRAAADWAWGGARWREGCNARINYSR